MIVIEELHKQSLYTTLKHFPGHGSSTSDSHQGFVDVTNTWSAIELIPYENIINAGAADFIMTAHIFNSNWDADYPATLSKNVITGILREQLGYQGVVISDDMNMKAITDFYGLEQALKLSINAGVDIIVFGNNLIYDEEIASKAIAIIKELVDNGEISKDRINEAYDRIMDMKIKMKDLRI
jgi:beta-N-acetylhexosaminidase